MALDPEQRKQQRQIKNKKRRKDQRKLILKLSIVLVVLFALVFGIVLLAKGCAAAKEQAEKQQDFPKTVIHIAAAGDLNVTDGVVASGGADYEFTDTFADVAHLLADADICVMNFEGNLVGAPYGSEFRSAPQGLMEALDAAGVDLLQMANSYSMKNGTAGLESTLNGIRAAGMEPVGAYASEREFQKSGGYTICTVNGIKVAFVAFTKGMERSATLLPGYENCVNVLYKDYNEGYQEVDSDKINRILDAVEKEKPDITVALVHWGSEYMDPISSSQDQIRKILQNREVDAIIGTHSHYVQKMEFDQENGKFLAYSLGDFFGDVPQAGTEYSVILDLEITRNDRTGEVKISNYSYTPVFTVSEPDRPLRVVRIAEAMEAYSAGYLDRVSEETYNKMVYALTRIEARISG